MEWWHYLIIGLGALLLLFILTILIRAINFKPKQQINPDDFQIDFDRERAVNALSELVKCKTISNVNPELEDDSEFEKLIGKLPVLYPNFYKACELKRFDGRALLFRWKGKSSGNPVVLMSHYDVVPVDESKWQRLPFGGEVVDGVLWGRGSLDTKSTLNGALFSADTLIAQGFVPEKDVYFAFSGGEEISNDGALNIVNYFEQNGIEPEFVLDEGGAVVKNVFPGVKEPCGLIGVAEKGMIDVKYTVKSSGGHASAPKPNTPLVVLSKTCCKLEKHPFKFRLSKPVLQMFDTLGRRSTFVYKLIFSNLWLFKGVLDLICKKSGGEINALGRTTMAFTQFRGSDAPNVLPTDAVMVCNMRLNPGDTVESVLKRLKNTVSDDRVEISTIRSNNPSRISRTDCQGYERIEKAIISTWKGTVVSPYLMVQCSDSRHYGKISDRVFRFSAMDLTTEERATIHGSNERIRLETIYSSVEFYIRLLKQC
jgi:carboxypeptidase PM20D1